LARFGIGTEPKKFAAIFLLGSIILFSVSVLLFAGLDMNSLKNQLGEIITNSAFSVTYQP
jgi:sensor c-di-GMP phosphodiesterase-like protein